MKSQDILRFWFEELDSKKRFAKDDALDTLMRERFEETLEAAARGELWQWRDSATGRLAEIIVLDQFSRNIWRDTPGAFAQDDRALTLARELHSNGGDKTLPIEQRAFAYMPYMHSESLRVHEQAVRIFSQPGLESNLVYELRHKAIIERFGRFPHRNAILGRASTPEEEAFLKVPGTSF
jgi:uncharacterized protein (DUF924 family)